MERTITFIGVYKGGEGRRGRGVLLAEVAKEAANMQVAYMQAMSPWYRGLLEEEN